MSSLHLRIAKNTNLRNQQDWIEKSHVVVNSAGIMPLPPIASGDLEIFDKVINTNLRGTFVALGQGSKKFLLAEG